MVGCCKHGLHKMWEIFGLDEKLLDSQEEFCSMELVSKLGG